MAKNKLFAMEELDGEGTEVEMEVSPEAGEVADVQVDVEQELGDVTESADAIDEGMGAADQLKEVETVVSDAVKEGEGLDPVAAEAIRIAVEAICSRVGANPKSVYALYATENFQSASSRKANSKIALEGIGEFLKDLWAKIKAALTNLWEKVKAFWNKHLSSLGRAVKALESMKVKVSALKGTPTNEQVEVPSGLKSVFPVKASLGIEEILGFAKTLEAASKQVDGFHLLDDMGETATLASISAVAKKNKGPGSTIKFGSESAPMPGGNYQSWEFKVEVEVDDGVETATLDVQEDSGKAEEAHKNAQLEIANKEKLKALIDATLKVAKELVKYRDKADKRAKSAQQAMKALDKEIDGLGTDAKKNGARSNLRTFNIVMSKGPVIETKLLGYYMTMIKGVLSYTDVCIKNTRKI